MKLLPFDRLVGFCDGGGLPLIRVVEIYKIGRLGGNCKTDDVMKIDNYYNALGDCVNLGSRDTQRIID